VGENGIHLIHDQGAANQKAKRPGLFDQGLGILVYSHKPPVGFFFEGSDGKGDHSESRILQAFEGNAVPISHREKQKPIGVKINQGQIFPALADQTVDVFRIFLGRVGLAGDYGVSGSHLTGQIQANLELIQIALHQSIFALTRAESSPGNSEKATGIAALAGAYLDAYGLRPELMLPMGYSVFSSHMNLLPFLGNLGYILLIQGATSSLFQSLIFQNTRLK